MNLDKYPVEKEDKADFSDKMWELNRIFRHGVHAPEALFNLIDQINKMPKVDPQYYYAEKATEAILKNESALDKDKMRALNLLLKYFDDFNFRASVDIQNNRLALLAKYVPGSPERKELEALSCRAQEMSANQGAFEWARFNALIGCEDEDWGYYSVDQYSRATTFSDIADDYAHIMAIEDEDVRWLLLEKLFVEISLMNDWSSIQLEIYNYVKNVIHSPKEVPTEWQRFYFKANLLLCLKDNKAEYFEEACNYLDSCDSWLDELILFLELIARQLASGTNPQDEDKEKIVIKKIVRCLREKAHEWDDDDLARARRVMVIYSLGTVKNTNLADIVMSNSDVGVEYLFYLGSERSGRLHRAEVMVDHGETMLILNKAIAYIRIADECFKTICGIAGQLQCPELARVEKLLSKAYDIVLNYFGPDREAEPEDLLKKIQALGRIYEGKKKVAVLKGSK